MRQRGKKHRKFESKLFVAGELRLPRRLRRSSSDQRHLARALTSLLPSLEHFLPLAARFDTLSQDVITGCIFLTR